jgi:hypothetical protein
VRRLIAISRWDDLDTPGPRRRLLATGGPRDPSEPRRTIEARGRGRWRWTLAPPPHRGSSRSTDATLDVLGPPGAGGTLPVPRLSTLDAPPLRDTDGTTVAQAWTATSS